MTKKTDKVVNLVKAIEEVGNCALEMIVDRLPEETLKHLKAAKKEKLLAIRSVIDSAITRLEKEEKESQKKGKGGKSRS